MFTEKMTITEKMTKIREIEKVNPEWKDLAAEEGQDIML